MDTRVRHDMTRTAGHRMIDFMGVRRLAYIASGTMVAISMLAFLLLGFNYGIDFAGGLLVQVRFAQPVAAKEMREALAPLSLGEVVIQEFGTPDEVMIRVEQTAVQRAGTEPKGAKAGKTSDSTEQSTMAQTIVRALQPLNKDQPVELRRVEFVGPQVGEELKRDGIMATLLSIVAILIYIAIRFEFRFAVGAVLALVHDVVITMGVFSLFHREVTLVVVAAVLTVIGYSLNDTIVIFDRIREDMKRMRRVALPEIIHSAINSTLSRTIVTSLTVVIVLVAILLFGGEVIRDFALALFIGVVIGTYSSIFIASQVVLLFDRVGAAMATREGQPE
jgi:preprotein translocase subunit SecF